MTNTEVSAYLDEIADLLELKGETHYRVNAYRGAARSIEVLADDVEKMAAEGRLEEIYGVGASIASKIEDYVRTGHSRYLDELRTEIPPAVRELLVIPGLGPSKARQIHQVLGVETVAQLAEAARDHRLQMIPGMGEKTEAKILREIERLQERTKRMLIGTALPAAEEVVKLLQQHPAVRRIETAGSLRRMQETIGDIDIIASSENPDEVTRAFAVLPIVKEVLGRGPTRSSILTRANLQIDLRVVHPDEYGAALQHFTGSKQHSIAMRDIAIRHGKKLNEYGIFDERTGERLASEEETDVYGVLGLQWMPPEMRQNSGEIEAAMKKTIPTLVERADIRGDLQMHSDWSDGTVPMETMVQACKDRGYEYAAITDHSQGLRVAHGLSIEQMERKLEQLQELNRQVAPFKLLAATEVDIKNDGTLDYPDEVLAQLDFVVVSIHNGFEQDRDRITGRILSAFENPYVDMMAHPTGRLLNRRPGYDVDLEKVLRAAAERGIAMEINASPERLDLSDRWARRAKELGVTIAINTDAHAPNHLDFMRYGIGIARRAWLTKDDVLNTLSLKELLAWRRHRLDALDKAA